MPLDAASLDSQLQTLFSSPPGTYAECGQAWADAAQAYAAGVIPASTAVPAASSILSVALDSAFQLPDAIPAMETAFATFALTIGAGMAPAFVATPPPSQVGFATQFGGPNPETHAQAASEIKTIIDAWMRTGTAVPSGGGAAVPWS